MTFEEYAVDNPPDLNGTTLRDVAAKVWADAKADAAPCQQCEGLAGILAEIVEHIESCDEDELLGCDNDPHPPSVFSVLADKARAAIAAVKGQGRH